MSDETNPLWHVWDGSRKYGRPAIAVVTPGAQIIVRLRDGFESTGRAGAFVWTWGGASGDIVAWREAAEPAQHVYAGLPDAALAALDKTRPATQRQEGGDHYKKCAIQPIEFIFANNIGFAEGNVVKYVTRWKSKGGVADLKKARHYLDLLIESVEGAPGKTPS